MGIVAWFAERKLTRAMSKGELKPAPRTAAGQDELGPAEGFHISRADESAPPAQEVPEQP
jgi:hypothetical protein